MARRLLRLASPRHAATLAAFVGMCAWPHGLAAQSGESSTAAQLYERAQAKEQVARAAEPPAVKELRLAATAYEQIFRSYPKSGYADNALWQAAGLLSLAYERLGGDDDRTKAEHWLEWLKRQYPSSPLAKNVDAELRRLNTTANTNAPDTANAASKDLASTTSPAPTSSPAATSGPAAIKSITTSPLPHGLRISIEFSHEVQFTGDRVENPDRVFFDFKNSTVSSAVIANAQ